MSGGGGNESIGGEQNRSGLPPFQNKAVRHAIGNQQQTYNQNAPYVGQLSAPNGPVAGIANQGNATENYFLSGQNAYASSNPYLQSYMNAADQNLVQNYQNAIAPSTNAEFAMADNFGGSSMMDAQKNNELALANAIGNTNANIAEPAYAQGIQQTQNAINQEPIAQGANYTGPFAQQTYQNNFNQGLMGLVNPYGYNQGNQYAPQQGITPGQGIGAGLGLAGLGLI